jgi:thiamine pyrophosphokinase
MQTVIFTGGAALNRIGALPRDAFIIAADSGLNVAVRAGVPVDVLIGDLDSVSPDTLDHPSRVLRFPEDKDATDLELAVSEARSRGASSLLVIGGGGGRVDHFLANASLLASQVGLDIEWRTGSGTLHRVNRSLLLTGTPGETVSLLAFGGPARQVRTNGLRWELDGEDLAPGSTRGVSNRFVATEAVVELENGNLLAVLPDR